MLDVEYVGKKGTRLYLAGGNNFNVLGPQIESLTRIRLVISATTCRIRSRRSSWVPTMPTAFFDPTAQAFQLLLPYPQFTGVTTDEPPTADSTYHALQVSVSKRYSNGLPNSRRATSGRNRSTIPRSMTLTWPGWGIMARTRASPCRIPTNTPLERSVSAFDMPQQVKFNYTYDLSIGRGRTYLSNMPRALDLVLGRMKTGGVWTIHDGFPLQFTVADGGSPIWTYGPQRPEYHRHTHTQRRSGIHLD